MRIRGSRVTSTDHTLFNALVTVRAQIPKNSTALIAEDDPGLVISATHLEASRTVRAALEALQATDIANRVQFVTAIQTAGQKAEALQFTVDAQAHLHRRMAYLDEFLLRPGVATAVRERIGDRFRRFCRRSCSTPTGPSDENPDWSYRPLLRRLQGQVLK